MIRALRLRNAAWLLALAWQAHAAFPPLYLKNVCDDQENPSLHAPTNITHAGDGSGRLFVCDQTGKIFIFQQGMLRPTPFLDLGSKVFVGTVSGYSERGLLGMAFHPDYETPGAPGHRRFYVNYTAPAATTTLNPSSPQNCVTVISEFQVSAGDPNLADPLSERVLLTYGQPQSNHNGGQLEFGPDGFLYIASGDGGGANDNQSGHTGGSGSNLSGVLGNAQDKTKLLGKILRIDPFGTNGQGGQFGIPADNPFAASAGTERKEIYAYGLRNPWRFCFDTPPAAATRLICADVGQLDVEEVNLIVKGGNYGWRVKEGTLDFDATTPYDGSPLLPPVAQYAHPGSTRPGTEALLKLGTSITGGYVYRGSAIPALQGKYVFGDYAANGIGGGGGILLGLEEPTPGVFTLSQITTANALPASARIYCFGVDEAGEMYMGTKTTSGVQAEDGDRPAGTLWKILPMSSVEQQIIADRDNTLYEPPTGGAYRSNGKGVYLFAGKTGDQAEFKVRRAVMRFDVSTIPPGAALSAASVRLTLDQQVGSGFTMKLHKLNADWGEGNSNAGSPGGAGVAAQTNDATWRHRFFSGTNWTTDGGDYAATESSSVVISTEFSNPRPTWTGAALLADVESWRATPASNFGWILIGDETQAFSAQRFISRESTAAADRPRLIVTYTANPPPTAYEIWYGTWFPDAPPGTFLDPQGDEDGDGFINQFEYAFGLNPLAKDDTSQGLTSSSSPAGGGGTNFFASFRRDTAALDLTYRLQSSADLKTWTTLATVTAGAAPAAQNGGSIQGDAVISGTLRLVTVRQTLAAGANGRRFMRLEIVRAP